MKWFERAGIHFNSIRAIRAANQKWKRENRNDTALLKELNRELKPYRVKMELKRYECSPFRDQDTDVIPIILKYARRCEREVNSTFLMTSLCSPAFYDAVPHLICFYRSVLEHYATPQDEEVLLNICDTIAAIGSDQYVSQYLELLNIPGTPASASLIQMLGKINSKEVETALVPLIEKENRIPNEWYAQPNEVDKYWCSQAALSYLADLKNTEYDSYLESFLTPQNLSWIYFTESEYSKSNYSECCRRYAQIAKQGLKQRDPLSSGRE